MFFRSGQISSHGISEKKLTPKWNMERKTIMYIQIGFHFVHHLFLRLNKFQHSTYFSTHILCVYKQPKIPKSIQLH